MDRRGQNRQLLEHLNFLHARINGNRINNTLIILLGLVTLIDSRLPHILAVGGQTIRHGNNPRTSIIDTVVA